MLVISVTCGDTDSEPPRHEARTYTALRRGYLPHAILIRLGNADTIALLPGSLGSTSTTDLIRRRLFDRIVAPRIEAEQIPGLLHMRWQRRGDVDHACARMWHGNAARQKMQPVLHATRQLPVFACKIFGVADDRMADMRHMRAQLMGAAGHRLEREPGERGPGGVDDGVVGDRVACALLAMAGDPHHRFVLALLFGEKGGDAALPRLRHAGRQRPIDFARRARAERFGER